MSIFRVLLFSYLRRYDVDPYFNPLQNESERFETPLVNNFTKDATDSFTILNLEFDPATAIMHLRQLNLLLFTVE